MHVHFILDSTTQSCAPNVLQSAWRTESSGQQLFVLRLLRRVSNCSETLRLCIRSLVMLTPLEARKDLAMWTPLLCSKVASAVFFPSLLLFSLFAQSPSLPLFFPFLSLSCTHARLANVGVWEMTHLLHTSSSPDHIWAARKSIFLRLCSREREVMRRHYGELFSTFSFFPLHYVFFFTFCRVRTFNFSSLSSQVQMSFPLFTWLHHAISRSLGFFLYYESGKDVRTDMGLFSLT